MIHMVGGCIPDPVDTDDIPIRGFLDTSTPIPVKLSYQTLVPEMKDQGKIPVCVSMGCTTIKETIDNKNGEYGKLSALWLYDQCKRRDGDPYGEGTFIRTAMKVMAKQGLMPNYVAPFDGAYSFGKYNEYIFDEELAHPYKIKTYARLTDVEDMCRCLSQHGPFAMGVQTTDEFDDVDIDGYIPIHYRKVGGGHCIAVVGYDLEELVFFIVNSWGPGWGNNGCAKMPFEYWNRFGMDAWGIVDISPNEI